MIYWLAWAQMAMLVVATAGHIMNIGKEREPTTPRVVLMAMAINGGIFVPVIGRVLGWW